jgi:hypothetical protein
MDLPSRPDRGERRYGVQWEMRERIGVDWGIRIGDGRQAH